MRGRWPHGCLVPSSSLAPTRPFLRRSLLGHVLFPLVFASSACPSHLAQASGLKTCLHPHVASPSPPQHNTTEHNTTQHNRRHKPLPSDEKKLSMGLGRQGRKTSHPSTWLAGFGGRQMWSIGIHTTSDAFGLVDRCLTSWVAREDEHARVAVKNPIPSLAKSDLCDCPKSTVGRTTGHLRPCHVPLYEDEIVPTSS